MPRANKSLSVNLPSSIGTSERPKAADSRVSQKVLFHFLFEFFDKPHGPKMMTHRRSCLFSIPENHFLFRTRDQPTVLHKLTSERLAEEPDDLDDDF